MSQLRCIAVAAAAVLIAAWPWPAVAGESATDGAFSAGAAAFEAGDYEAALAEFERARAAGRDTPATHYNIGVSEYRLGRHEDAARTFARIASRFPAMRAIAEYNLGLALVKLGSNDAARAAFRRAAAGGDATVAELADAMLARLGSAAPATGSRWFGLVDVSVGHDDNVTLVDELRVPAGSSPESGFAELITYGDVAFGTDGRFGADASLYAIRYRDAGGFDQTVLRVALDYTQRAGAWRIGLGPFAEQSTFGGDGFERRAGFETAVQRPFAARAEFIATVTAAAADARSERFAFIDGNYARVRLGMRRRGERGFVRVDYEHERSDRQSDVVTSTRDGLRLRMRRGLTAEWDGTLRLRWRRSRYDAPRDETMQQLGLDAERDLGAGWRVVLGVSLTDNSSDDPAFAYRRRVWSAGLGKVF